MITITAVTPGVYCYLTAGGEYGFLRYQIRELSAGVPGFSGPSASRNLVEAVFVTAEDAELAALVLAASRVPSLRTVFDARGIPYRLPHGIHATEVIELPVADRASSGIAAARSA